MFAPQLPMFRLQFQCFYNVYQCFYIKTNNVFTSIKIQNLKIFKKNLKNIKRQCFAMLFAISLAFNTKLQQLTGFFDEKNKFILRQI